MHDINAEIGEHLFTHRVRGLMLRDDRVLVCRMQSQSWWFAPGGAVQAGESASQALRRELLEELNIQAEPERMLWLHEHFYTNQADHQEVHELGVWFMVHLSEDMLPQLRFSSPNDGGLEFAWVSHSELAQLDFYPETLRLKLFDPPTHLTHLLTKS